MPVVNAAECYFTEEQAARIDAHLKAKAASDACPLCSANNWEPSGPVGSPIFRRMADGRLFAGPELVPFLLLICMNCHYVMTLLWDPIVEGKT